MLTMTYVSRNDDHGGGLVPRIQTSIDSLIGQIDRYGLNLDLIFVEWNPVEGVPKIRDLIHYPSWFPVRFIEVPHKVHTMYKNSDKLNVFNAVGMNLGMRRAKGDWVLYTTHDILFSEGVARFLAREEFDDTKFYRAHRMETDVGKYLDRPIFELLELCESNITKSNAYTGTPGGLFTNASGDFILMSRDSYYALEGVPEWPIVGMYFDGITIARAYSMGLDQEILPYNVYHINHGSQGSDRMKTVQHLSNGYWKNIKKSSETRTGVKPLNNPGWGLGYAEEVGIGDGVIQLRTDQLPNNFIPT